MSNYIEVEELPFSSVTDSIKTEENALSLIKNNNVNLKHFLYIGVPLANTINKKGLQFTQSVIDRLQVKFSQKKIFVCQHIFVCKLNFYNNLVFTPHAEETDSFKILPHYNLFFKKDDYKDFNKRKCLASFLGAFSSDASRYSLSKINSDITPVLDTGPWHFEKSEYEQNKSKELYRKLLINSKFSFCPRGTGANTIRFYESLSTGSIPIVFNNIKVAKEIEPYIIRYDINKIDYLPEYLNTITNAGEMSKFIYNFYWNNFDNNFIHKLIEKNV